MADNKERNTNKPRGPMQSLDLAYNDKAGAHKNITRVIPPIKSFLGDLSAVDEAEIYTILHNNSGAFFDVDGAAKSWQGHDFYVWFNVTDGANTQTDPGGQGTSHKIDILSADAAAAIASKEQVITDAISGVSVGNSTTTNTYTYDAGGAKKDAVDVDAAVTATTTTQGIDQGLSVPSGKGGKAGGYVLIFNNSATVSFVKTGTDASNLPAPTGGANGIPIPPNDWLVISMGSNKYIRANAATTFGYVIDDESFIS